MYLRFGAGLLRRFWDVPLVRSSVEVEGREEKRRDGDGGLKRMGDGEQEDGGACVADRARHTTL